MSVRGLSAAEGRGAANRRQIARPARSAPAPSDVRRPARPPRAPRWRRSGRPVRTARPHTRSTAGVVNAFSIAEARWPHTHTPRPQGYETYGRAHIAYTPVERVVGLSKLAHLTDIFARRLQTQEHLTAQIAAAIDEVVKPRGVAVVIEAEHTCMSVRSVAKHGAMRSPAAYGHVSRRSGGTGAFHVHGARVGELISPYHREKAPCPHPADSHDIEEGLKIKPQMRRVRPRRLRSPPTPAAARSADRRAYERRSPAQDHRQRRTVA